MNIYICEADDGVQQYMEKGLAGHTLQFAPETAQDSAGNAEAEVLCVFVNSRVTEDVLAKFPAIKLIVTRSTGFDHIDLAACTNRGVIVCNVPTYGEHTVAEYAFALLLTLSRKVYSAVKRVHEEGKFHTEGLKGFDLQGKTLGVLGTGRIGCHVIEIANGFGMKVVAYDPFPKKEMEQTCHMQYVTLDELLEMSDVITIHTPYMPSTHHLLNGENMKRIKKGAILVNTARGAIVDTAALVSSLKAGTLAGAALDVLEEEGFVGEESQLLGSGKQDIKRMETVLADHALMSLPNVIVTPHNAFNTVEALERILEVSVKNILDFAAGKAGNIVKPN